MVEKHAFVKTIEVMLAALLLISSFNMIQERMNVQTEAIVRDPSSIENELIDLLAYEGVLSSIIRDYDYLRLDSLFDYLLPNGLIYYFEVYYFTRLTVTGDNNRTNLNLGFVYHFPRDIDKNSIRVLLDNYELPTEARFDWYRIPIRINTAINQEFVGINNITLTGNNISRSSLRFFINDNESIMDVEDWVEISGNNTVNASITVFIPRVDESADAYLYYATNNSVYNASPYSLSPSRNITVITFSRESTSTADVLFTLDELNASQTRSLYLLYALFTNEPNTYYNITSFNNTGINLDIENNYIKRGTTPLLLSYKGAYSVDRVIPTSYGLAKLVVYGGYS